MTTQNLFTLVWRHNAQTLPDTDSDTIMESSTCFEFILFEYNFSRAIFEEIKWTVCIIIIIIDFGVKL